MSLQGAALAKDVKQLETLLEDANPNERDESSRTALHCAAYSGAHECVKLLVLKGAEVNCRDKVSLDTAPVPRKNYKTTWHFNTFSTANFLLTILCVAESDATAKRLLSKSHQSRSLLVKKWSKG